MIVGGVLSSKVAALKQRLSPYQDKYIAYVLQYCIFESVRGKEGGSNGGRERAQERYAPGSGRLGGDKKFRQHLTREAWAGSKEPITASRYIYLLLNHRLIGMEKRICISSLSAEWSGTILQRGDIMISHR